VLETHEPDPAFAHPGVTVLSAEPYRITLSVDTAVAPIEQVIAAALQRLPVRDLVVEDTPLEEVVKAIYRSEPRRQHVLA
jgi:hypothetical protein